MKFLESQFEKDLRNLPRHKVEMRFETKAIPINEMERCWVWELASMQLAQDATLAEEARKYRYWGDQILAQYIACSLAVGTHATAWLEFLSGGTTTPWTGVRVGAVATTSMKNYNAEARYGLGAESFRRVATRAAEAKAFWETASRVILPENAWEAFRAFWDIGPKTGFAVHQYDQERYQEIVEQTLKGLMSKLEAVLKPMPSLDSPDGQKIALAAKQIVDKEKASLVAWERAPLKVEIGREFTWGCTISEGWFNKKTVTGTGFYRYGIPNADDRLWKDLCKLADHNGWVDVGKSRLFLVRGDRESVKMVYERLREKKSLE